MSMLSRSFKPAKCKTALKLATSRIKLMKNKRANHLKQLKRELAELLESGQDQTARVRVEHVVREEKTIAAYDLLDIYCELIVARLPIIEAQKSCPIDMKEAVASVVFASPRCADIPELQDVRKQFTAKYGKEFVTAALEVRPACGVSRLLVEKLSANAPDGPTKVKILTAIAEEHNVAWDPKSYGEKESKPYDDLLKGPNTFDEAHKMHFEPPIAQSPSIPSPDVHVPQGRDQKHDAPANHQQNYHSPSSQKFGSSDLSGGQSVPSAAPHPPLRPSGTEYETTEPRHSYPRDERTETRHSHSRDDRTEPRHSYPRDERTETRYSHFRDDRIEPRHSYPRDERSETRHSHSRDDRTETRHSRSRGENDLSLGGQNGCMEFKDATAAAQAAAESAERASMAARAAVQLSSNESITRRHSYESHKSNTSSVRDDRRRENNESPPERFSNDAYYNSPKDRNRQSGMPTEEADEYVHKSHYDTDERVYKDDHSSAKRFGQSASARSGTASVSAELKRQMDNFHEVDRYSRKSSLEKEAEKLDNSASLSGKRIDRQSSGEDRNNHFHSSSSGDGYGNSLSHQNVVFDDKEDPIDYGNSRRETVKSGTGSPGEAVFDTYESDDEIIKFDKQPLDHFAVNVDKLSGSSKKPLPGSCDSAEFFRPYQFDESSPKGPRSAHPVDQVPATFDDSSGPSSDSEDKLENSRFRGKLDSAVRSYKENDLSKKSNDLSKIDHSLRGSYLTGENDLGGSRKQKVQYSSDDSDDTEVIVKNKHRRDSSHSRKNNDYDDLGGSRKQKVLYSSDDSDDTEVIVKNKHRPDSSHSRKNNDYDDMSSSNSSSVSLNSEVVSNETTHRLSPQSSRISPVNKVKDTDDLYTSVSTNTMKTEVLDLSESESCKVFPMVIGGLRNKGYKVPPYTKSPSGDSLSSKGAGENNPIYTQSTPDFPRVERSSLSSVGPEVGNNSSLRARSKKYDLDMDDFEEEVPPQQNLQSNRKHTKENSSSRTQIKNHDLGIDNFEKKVPNQKFANKQEKIEDYTKSKFSAPPRYFDSDDNDSEEELPKQPPVKIDAVSRISRRTKANSTPQTSVYSKTKHGSSDSMDSSSVPKFNPDVSGNKPKPRPQSEYYSTARPAPEEKSIPSAMQQPASPLKTTTSAGNETLRTSSGEAPSREGSLKKPSHVHPKLPDYDSITALLQPRRQSSG